MAFKIEGFVEVDYHCSITGKLLIKGERQKNVITDLGLQEFLKMLVGVGRNPSHIEVGTGTTDADRTDTVIETPIPAENLPFGGDLERRYNDGRGKLSTVTLLPTDPELGAQVSEVSFKRFLEEAEDDDNNQTNTTSQTNLNGKTITEAGLFNRYKLGTMLSRKILDTPIVKVPGLNPAINWVYRVTRNPLLIGAPNIITNKGVELFARAIMGRKRIEFDQEKYFGHDGWINRVAVGNGAISTPLENDPGLNQEIPGDGRLPPTRCAFDFSDLDEPKVRIQRLVTSAMVGDTTITEAGLFHYHREKGNFRGQFTEINDMFSRAKIEPGLTINAGQDQVLTWDVSLRRG